MADSPLPVATAPAVTTALATAIDSKLAGTPMKGTGRAFVSAGNAYGVNPWFLVSIAGVESQWGSKGFATNGSHNPFGLGVTGQAGAGMRFASWEAAIRKAASTLGGPLYKGAGKVSIRDIGARWAADPGWGEKVAAIYGQLTGSKVLTTEIVVGGGRNLPQPDPSTSPIDALGNIADPVAGALSGLVSLIARIFDPSTWLRILAALGGTIAVVLAILFLFRSQRGARR